MTKGDLSFNNKKLHSINSALFRSCCDKLGELADCCIREVTDPLLLQPASLDVATVRKKTEEELGKQSYRLITPGGIIVIYLCAQLVGPY